VGSFTLNQQGTIYNNGADTYASSGSVTSGNYYTLIVQNQGTDADCTFSVLETTYNPKIISTITAAGVTASTFATAYIQQAIAVTANASAALSSGEYMYIRYTTDNWANSQMVSMSLSSGTTYTGSIPGQASGTAVKYYVLTSNSSSVTSTTADYLTLELDNNSNSNYSYTVASSYGATTTGNWNTLGTWANGAVPASGSAVTIAANVTLDAAATVGNITINSGATLNGSSNTLTVNSGSTFTNNGTFNANTGTVTVSGNATFTNNGTFNANTGTVLFAGSGTTKTLTGTFGFNNVEITGGGVTFSAASTVNSTLILSGGYISTAPIYATGSTLKYNVNYNRSNEWKTASGAGYPYHVQLSNNSVLDPGANSNTGTVLNCAGNLTIDAGSAIYLDFGSDDMTVPLIVGGNLVMSGSLSASDVAGGDIKIGGNWTRTGTFAPKARAVFFNGGSGDQTVTATSGETFDYMIVDKSSGSLVLASNVSCNQTLTLTNGNMVLGSNSLFLATAASGGSTGSHVVTDGAGKLTISNFTGSKTFPVGPTTAIYAPVTVNNMVSARNFSINVGTTVTSPTDATKVVNLQWDITPSNASGNNADLTFSWPASSQASGFGYVSGMLLQVGHYNTGTSTWDVAKTGTISGSDPYSVTGTGFTNFSPFAVGSLGALPVELVDFKAVAKDNTTLLNWSTASEKNNDHFEVERSYNATNWQTITTVKGHGTTNLPQQYNYTDVQANAGLNYYRLKQVDDNGAFTYSKIVSVLVGKGSALKTYPNPAATELTILGMDESGSIQILDGTGKLIKTVQGTNLLNINDLPNGVYFVRGFDAAGAAFGTTRFVKN
jgi:hypothetical protein